MRLLLLTILCFCFLLNSAYATDQRYISLAPSTTEILFALGLGDKIIGISSYCNYPKETKGIDKVGDFSNPNIEKIIFLKPDYIFCTGLEQAPVITQLKKLKLRVYVADPKNISELFTSIKEIGEITHKTKEADALIKSMQDEIEAIDLKVRIIPKDKRVRVFLEIWHEPLMTAGKGSFVDELITLAGGINIAHDVNRPYCNYSAEKVIALDPQCIIMTYMDKKPPLEIIHKRFGWDKISAVRNKQVFNDISPDILVRPGPRVTKGIAEIYKRLYQ